MSFFWRYKLDHLLFWAATIAFYAYIRSDVLANAGVYHYVVDMLVRNGALAIICYLNIHYFYPQYLKKGKYFMYGSLVFLSLLAFAAIKNAHDMWLFGYVLADSSRQQFFNNTYYHFSIALFYMAFTLALEQSKNLFRQQVLLREIQVEKLKTELRFLKAQINQHFLFNSINTIYFLIDKSNFEARDTLQKFSELLRYQLYECNEELIPIEKEVEYLKSYVDLQRLRKHEDDVVHFNADDNIRDFRIAPLLLIPFVENAFKHVSHVDGKANQIHVALSRQNGHFLFDVINSKDGQQHAGSENGIGLKNVQRRLELLYDKRYDLTIRNEQSRFSVQLKLQLQ
ncbi:MAG TPA: histidine kinase [Chitinophagaceae bacterium]|nr:histidine kinase [Chitinophagaceae bacterium]